MIAVTHPDIVAADEQMLILIARLPPNLVPGVLQPVHPNEVTIPIDRNVIVIFVKQMDDGIHLDVEGDHCKSFPKPLRA